MKKLNKIGLDTRQVEVLSKQLNALLANYSVFYQNVRAYHWNIKGDNFFELHVKFEELYNDLIFKIDEIAERILTLGFKPEHRYSMYQNVSQIKEKLDVTIGKDGMQDVLSSIQTILILQRLILSLAGEAKDEGTQSLMSDYIKEQEKLVWMYSSFLQQ